MLPQYINSEDIRSWLHSLYSGTNVHVRQWIDSTLFRYERSSCRKTYLYRVAEVCYERCAGWRLDNRIHGGSEILPYHNSKVELVYDTLPEWQQRLIRGGKLLYWLTPNRASVRSSRITHILDHLAVVYADKPIRLPYEAAHELANTVTRRVFKLNEGLLKDIDTETGTVVLDSKVLYDRSLYCVELVEEVAYKAEGLIMKHCVATYWGRKTRILSIRPRSKSSLQPMCTIELAECDVNTSLCGTVTKTWCVIQAQCVFNTPPDEALLDTIEAWCKEQGFMSRLGIRCAYTF